MGAWKTLVVGHAADACRVLPRGFWPSWPCVSPRASTRRHLVLPLVSCAAATTEQRCPDPWARFITRMGPRGRNLPDLDYKRPLHFPAVGQRCFPSSPSSLEALAAPQPHADPGGDFSGVKNTFLHGSIRSA